MLEVSDLSISFERNRGTQKSARTIHAIENLSLSVKRGECIAIAGSSGSGKSVLAHALLGILPGNAKETGGISFKGTPLTADRRKRIRGKEIALVPQAVTFLNPLIRNRNQVIRSSVLSGRTHSTAAEETRRVFSRLDLDDRAADGYPFQLSGGMARRVLVSSVMVTGADLIIADEPTTGLDHSLAAESMTYLKTLADEGRSVIIITHDLEAVIPVADRIAVMYGGSLVEVTTPHDFTDGNQYHHPYTRALRDCLPRFGLVAPPSSGPGCTAGETGGAHGGCAYAGRCPVSTGSCADSVPRMKDTASGQVWCHHA